MNLIQRIKKLMDLKGMSTLEVMGAIVVLFITIVMLAATAKFLIKWVIIVGAIYLIGRYLLGVGSRSD